MNEQNHALFRRLVKAYNEDNFKATIDDILKENEMKENELCNIISTLCGVDCISKDNFYSNLKQCIEEYLSNSPSDHNVVNKIRECSMRCADENGKTICQKTCPFEAINVDLVNGTSYIEREKCTDCGSCVEACPSNTIMDKVEFIPLLNLLKEKVPVIAAVAPAISGQFGENVTLNQLRAAFKKIGFNDMVEVAFFADMLTMKEAVEFSHHVKDKDDFLITSCCCPMWVAMLKRVYNDLVKHVSPSVSPMIAAGRVLKKINPDCKVVFVGPCIAKKAEAKEKDLIGDIDFVLTFAELKDIFEALDVHPELLQEDETTEYASRGGRLYAREGGVSIAVTDVIKELFPGKYEFLSTINASGVKDCRELLKKIESKEISANFIEGMGCTGGCVGGPKALIPTDTGRKAVNAVAEASDIKIPTESLCMEMILNKININSKVDFMDEEKTLIFHRDFSK